MTRRVFSEEVAITEKKIQSYSARMSALETALAQTQRGMGALKEQEESLTQQLSNYLQKLTVIQKRVFGSFLSELGVGSVQQLESEVLTRLKENERMQSECRTHIALIEGKQQYGQERLRSIVSQIEELRQGQKKSEKKAREIESRLSEVTKEADEEEEQLETIQRVIGRHQKEMKDIEVITQEIDKKIREVGVGGARDA